MKPEWYVRRNDKEQGPYSVAKLRDAVSKGFLGPNDVVRQEGSDRWVAAGSIPGLTSNATAPRRTTASKPADPVTAQQEVVETKRFPWLWLLVCAVSVLVVIGGIGFVYRDSQVRQARLQSAESDAIDAAIRDAESWLVGKSDNDKAKVSELLRSVQDIRHAKNEPHRGMLAELLTRVEAHDPGGPPFAVEDKGKTPPIRLNDMNDVHDIEIANAQEVEESAPKTDQLVVDGADVEMETKHLPDDVPPESGDALAPVSLSGHVSPVNSLAFSPNGDILASAAADGSIRLWQVKTKIEVARFDGHAKSVNRVRFSSDGQFLLSASDDFTVRVWDLSKGIELHRFVGHAGRVMDLDVSRDGKTVVSCDTECVIRLWDLARKVDLRIFQSNQYGDLDKAPINCVAFLPNGVEFASAGGDFDGLFLTKLCQACLWKVGKADPLRRFPLEKRPINCLAPSPNGDQLVLASENEASVWNTREGICVRRLATHSGRINSIAVSGDGKLLVTGSDDRMVGVWKLASGERFCSFPGHATAIRAVAISPGNDIVAAGESSGTIQIWTALPSEVNDGRVLPRKDDLVLHGHKKYPISLGLTADSKKAITCSGPEEICVWDIDNGALLNTFEIPLHGGTYRQIAVAPDGRFVIVAAHREGILAMDVQKQSFIEVSPQSRTKGYGYAPNDHLSLAPDGKMFVAVGRASQGNVAGGRVGPALLHWSVPQFKCRSVVWLPSNYDTWPHVSAISHNGSYLAVPSSSIEQKSAILYLVALSNGKQVKELKGHSDQIRCICFSPDDATILSGGDDHSLILWNARSGELTARLEGHTGAVTCAAFLPGGKQVVSGSSDHSIVLWDVETRKSIRTFHGHQDEVTGIAVGSDGTVIVTASKDKSVRTWRLSGRDGDFNDIARNNRVANDKHGGFPSRAALSGVQIQNRATHAIGNSAPPNSLAMAVAFAKVTLLERLLLLADEQLTEAEYYALLRFMIRSEFVAEGIFEPLAEAFATALSDDTYRDVTTRLVNRMEFLEKYREWVEFIANNPAEVQLKGAAVLAAMITELRAEGVFPELQRLRRNGPAEQNSLAELAKKRATHFVEHGGGPVEWKSILDLLGPLRNPNHPNGSKPPPASGGGKPGGAKPGGGTTSPSTPGGNNVISVEVVFEFADESRARNRDFRYRAPSATIGRGDFQNDRTDENGIGTIRMPANTPKGTVEVFFTGKEYRLSVTGKRHTLRVK